MIWIEDSFKSGACIKNKRSLILNPRNPLKTDETVINYDLDSEEEWNEENGEDLNSQKMEEDDDYGDEAEEQDGFIVSDNHLSDDEILNNQYDTDDERDNFLAGFQSSNQIKQDLQTYTIIFTRSDQTVLNYMKDFKAVSFNETKEFPVQLKHKSQVEIGLTKASEEDNEHKKKKGAMNEHIIDLIRFLHGSQISK